MSADRVAVVPGTASALAARMDEGNDPRRRSARLAAASRQLISKARDHIEATRQHLDRARNAIQVVWLLRAVRKRQRK